MGTTASAEGVMQPGVRTPRPYMPSWADWLTARVRRLPVPPWVFYLGLALALVLGQAATQWADGTYPVGTFNFLHVVMMCLGVYGVALIHYLNDDAAAALAAFRPVLRADEGEYQTLRARLTTMPALPALLLGLALALWTAPFPWTDDKALLHQMALFTSPLASVVAYSAFILMWFVLGTFIYHTIWQLRVVSHIYTTRTRVSLFELGPLYAFSGLAMRTAIGFILIPYVWNVTLPGSWDRVETVTSAGPLIVIGLATFILPLYGVHRLLQAEKERRKAEAARDLDALMTEMQRLRREGHYADLAPMSTALDGLIKEQGVIEKISTWPWEPETLRGLATALLLPIILWLITHLLERFTNF